MIEVIPLWRMFVERYGTLFGWTILVCWPLSVLGGFLMMLNGRILVGLLGVGFFGLSGYVTLIGGRYLPRRSFRIYRVNFIEKSIQYRYPLTLALAVLFLVDGSLVRSWPYMIGGLVSMYVLRKSIPVHRDVDFVVNHYLANALGLGLGGRALVSYQNFDAEDVRKGSIAFAASTERLVVAWHDGRQWQKQTRDLRQIRQIGIIGDQDNSCLVKFVFADDVTTLLRIELSKKLSSTPALVVRRLLEVIDASIEDALPASAEYKRRRVVVDPSPEPTSSCIAEPSAATSPMLRTLELSPSILEEIRAAHESPTRRLEL